MIIFYSGSMPVIMVQPERAIPEQKPSVMLTYFEVRDGLFGARKRFKDHSKRRRDLNNASKSGRSSARTPVSSTRSVN